MLSVLFSTEIASQILGFDRILAKPEVSLLEASKLPILEC
jgi:hypothetical protein